MNSDTLHQDDYDFFLDILERTYNNISTTIPTDNLSMSIISSIYRDIHSFKSNVMFFDLNNITHWCNDIEFLLTNLKSSLTLSSEILNWLNNISKQLEFWIIEINHSLSDSENKVELRFIDIFKKTYEFSHMDKTFIYDIPIIYYGNNKNIFKVLKYKFNKTININTVNKLMRIFQHSEAEIVILDNNISEFEMKTIKNYITDVKFIMIDRNDNCDFEYVFNPSKQKLKELQTLVTDTIVNDSKLLNKFDRREKLQEVYMEYLLDNVPDLPSSVQEIKNIIEDDDFYMDRLIDAVKNDQISTLMVLNHDTELSKKFNNSIEKIVPTLNKHTIFKILIENVTSKIIIKDLSPYNLTIAEFKKLNKLRYELAKKRNLSDRDSLIVFLSTLGQYIISEYIMFMKKTETFKILSEEQTIFEAEKIISKVHTLDVTAYILDKWNITSESIEFLYSDELMKILKKIKIMK